MFKNLLVFVVLSLVLVSCWSDNKDNNMVNSDVNTLPVESEEKIEVVETSTWEVINVDDVALEEFEKELDNLFDELENAE